MKILITGNLGYVGTILSKKLNSMNHDVIGVDLNFFKSTLTKKPKIFKQLYKDFRNLNSNDLKNIDAIVHLAAISNDPIGNFFSNVTYDVNYRGSINLAKLAKKNKVKKFVFASSCSIYGWAGE